MLHNTAQVDPYKPDFDEYPKMQLATPYECHLYPGMFRQLNYFVLINGILRKLIIQIIYLGDMLYIPPKWWHHVRSLDVSFSVSFWWE